MTATIAFLAHNKVGLTSTMYHCYYSHEKRANGTQKDTKSRVIPVVVVVVVVTVVQTMFI